MTRISVCIATYNGEKYLKQQIDSVISQLNTDDEIVISDDGSTDQTIYILESYKDERIKIYTNTNKHGVIHNIENALKNSTGKYIFLCDQDDVWVDNKVKISLEALKNYDLVVSDCFITDENLNIIQDSFYKQHNSKSNKWLALLRNPYLGCCLSFKRTVLDLSLPFPKNIPMHDSWIGNVGAFKFKSIFIAEKLIYYRRHGNNASTTSEPSKASILKQLNFRLPIICGLIRLKNNS